MKDDKENEEIFKAIFDHYAESTGFITVESLKRSMTRFGKNMTEEEVETVMAQYASED